MLELDGERGGGGAVRSAPALAVGREGSGVRPAGGTLAFAAVLEEASEARPTGQDPGGKPAPSESSRPAPEA
ncbi:MAG: hypothetical protein AB1505_34975, partial [Candidatus Latescibacterota bacterium]